MQQRGFNTQIGFNVRRWLALGFDYSIQEGHASLVTADLKPQYQADLNNLVATYGPAFGLPSTTSSRRHSAQPPRRLPPGPSSYRHFKKFTLFVHPSIGAMHEDIDLHSHDLFTKMVVIPALVPTLVSTLTPDDTTYFYGFGGGADFNATKHVHLRADVEFVHVYLFSGILKDSRNSVRLSVGPTFNFGKNVTK